MISPATAELTRLLVSVNISQLYRENEVDHVGVFHHCMCNYEFKELMKQIHSTGAGRKDRQKEMLSFFNALLHLKKGMLDDGRCIHVAATILREFAERAEEICANLTVAVRTLALEQDCWESVETKTDKMEKYIKQPCTVERPYHEHHTSHASGGGDFTQIARRLEQYYVKSFITPRPWVVSGWSFFEEDRKFFQVNEFDAIHMLEIDEVEDACYESIKIARILKAVGLEARDMYLEMVTWKALPCAMSLHQRLGRESCLGWLGKDLLQIVMQFVNE